MVSLKAGCGIRRYLAEHNGVEIVGEAVIQQWTKLQTHVGFAAVAQGRIVGHGGLLFLERHTLERPGQFRGGRSHI